MKNRAVTALLSEKTSSDHRRVEDALRPILERGGQAWRWYFARMFGVHAAIEPLLWSGPWCGELDVERRSTKSAWLRRDLLRMGMDETAVDVLPRMPLDQQAWSDAARWGMAWVLEGSSLGNRVLASMAPTAYRQSQFLRGYGEKTAESWQSFRNALDRVGQERLDADQVADSAIALFRRLGDWLALEGEPRA